MRTVRIALLAAARARPRGGPGARPRSGQERTPKAAGLERGDKAILRAVFASSLPDGSYRVAWRALADDGHHEKGSWTFHVG
jgi:methionine-rich copper-binding protein CopC